MDEAQRIARPKLDRTGPIRAFSGLFGGPSGHNGKERDGSLESAVSRSVELGYRVVDDYLRLGQQMAARVGERSSGPLGGVQDFQDLAARMARYASDLTEIWFQLMELTARGGAAASSGSNGAAAAAPPTAGPATPSVTPEPGDGEVHVAVELASIQPAEVTLDLHPGAMRRSVVVHALRAADAEKPRLGDVRLRPASADEPSKLTIRIPSDQPPGIYNGLVIDEQTSRPVGTISVRVGEVPR